MKKWIVYLAVFAAGLALLIFLARASITLAAGVLERRYPPPGRMVPVGDYKLHLYCSGAGAPTVVIEPGLGVDWVGWRFVIPKLLSTNRVCVYDRAGYGWSDPGPKPRTASREAEELHTLLARGGVAPPYLLVAHSYGGYIARIYASRFRDSLAAVVLVDPSQEDEPALVVRPAPVEQARHRLTRALLNLIPPLGIDRLKRMYEGEKALPADLKDAPPVYRQRYLAGSSLTQLQFEHSELDSMSLTRDQVRQAPFPRDLPLTVITALRLGRPDLDPTELPASHRELQARLARSSQFGRQIVAERSGHMVSLDQPEVIVRAVRDQLAAASPDRSKGH